MSSTIYGFTANELKPSHELSINRSEDGLWTASHMFTCSFTDYSGSVITELLKPGTPITDMDSVVPYIYNFISIESHSVSHKRGGITEVRVQYSGASADDGFDDEGRSEATSWRGVMGKKPIIEHPNYIKEVTAEDADKLVPIAAWYLGEANREDDGSGHIIYNYKTQDSYGGVISSPNTVKWIEKIAAGIRTFDAPMIEWSITSTNGGGITDTDLNEFGRGVPLPPGDPPMPPRMTDGWWHFSDLSEDKTDSSSTYVRTYTLHEEAIDQDIYYY